MPNILEALETISINTSFWCPNADNWSNPPSFFGLLRERREEREERGERREEREERREKREERREKREERRERS